MRSALHGTLPTHVGSGVKVVFEDLFTNMSDCRGCAAAPRPAEALGVSEGLFEAAVQGAQLLHREALTITQRNINRNFTLLKRLVAMRNLGTLVDIESSYWPDRFFLFTGQVEELSRISTKVLLDTLDAMIGQIRHHSCSD
jgi:hypothetical protein